MSSLSLPQKRGRSLYCTRRRSGFKHGVHFLGGGGGRAKKEIMKKIMLIIIITDRKKKTDILKISNKAINEWAFRVQWSSIEK